MELGKYKDLQLNGYSTIISYDGDVYEGES